MGQYEECIHYYEGQPIRLRCDMETNDIYMNVDDLAKAFGFQNAIEMFSNDEMLDKYNVLKKKFPDIELVNGVQLNTKHRFYKKDKLHDFL